MFRPGSILYRLVAIPGQLLIRAFEWLIRRAAGDDVFFDNRDFPWVARLEGGWEDIRSELVAVMNEDQPIPNFEDLSEEQARITKHRDSWKTFFFYAYGQEVSENCARCPRTAELLQEIPQMTTAMFSILHPQGEITPHRGPFKGVLRFHLGLIIPESSNHACAIRVADEVRSWEEGKGMVFDDTHEHEAWNRTDDIRVVLFVDFARNLPFPLSSLNRGMIKLIGGSPFIKNMMDNVNQQAGRVDDAAVADTAKAPSK